MARVLVVDDIELVRDLCERMLEPAGHEIVHAVSGEEAIERYKEERPDAVLLDVVMPGMGGLAALGALRALDPDARIAMLTSQHEEHLVRRAVELGARDYVAKPFQRERLLAAVDKLIGD